MKPKYIEVMMTIGIDKIGFATTNYVLKLENFVKTEEITLTKDLDRDLFSRYIGKIPANINPSKIICVVLEEGSGAPSGYSIYNNTISAFYFKYYITTTRTAKIIYF